MDRTLLFMILIFAFAIVTGCGTKVKVHSVDDKSDVRLDKDGVFYALPKTVVSAKIPLKKIVKKPGEVGPCAKDVLGVQSQVIKKEEASIELGIPEFMTRGVPDPKEIYMVEVDGGFLAKQDMTIKLTEAGLITSIKATITDQSLDLAVTTLETAATIAGKAIAVTAKEGQECKGEILKKANGHKKAIEKIRETKRMLVSGQIKTNIDGAALAIMLKRLDDEELKRIQAFIGTKKTTAIWTPKFEFTPDKPETKELFEIKTNCIELINDDDKKIIPVPTEFLCSGPGIVKVDKVKLVISQPEDEFSKIVNDHKHKGGSEDEKGFRYRIPALTRVKLVKEKIVGKSQKLVATDMLPISQFGTIVTLPASTGPGETGFDLNFYTKTGGLQSISVTSASISPQTISRTGAAVGTILEATRDNEMKKLTETRDELKLKVDIEELKEKYRELKKAEN